MSNSQEGNSDSADIFVHIRLKKERKRLGFSQDQMAESLSVTSKTVSRWEKGSAIPSNMLNGMSVLGFDVHYMLTGEPPELRIMLASIKNATDIVYALDGLTKIEQQQARDLLVGISTSNADFVKTILRDIALSGENNPLMQGYYSLDDDGKAAVNAMINALPTKKDDD